MCTVQRMLHQSCCSCRDAGELGGKMCALCRGCCIGPVLAVVMLESRVARCVHCAEDVALVLL